MQVANSINISNTESELISRVKQGDNHAFETLVKQYEQMVFRTCMGFVHNSYDAEDLTQEVFVQLFQSVQTFRGDAKLSTWLYRIAVNKSLNFVRSRKNKSWIQSVESFFVGEKKSDLQIEDADSSTDAEIENQDRAKALHTALGSLPKNQQVAFTLSKYDDLTYTEIAEVMELSVSSVESLLFRAKKNLQKKLLHVYKEL